MAAIDWTDQKVFVKTVNKQKLSDQEICASELNFKFFGIFDLKNSLTDFVSK